MSTNHSITSAAATLGRKGGLAKSAAKRAASAMNGRKGGRPRGFGDKTTLIKGHALNEMNEGALCRILKRRAFCAETIYRVEFNGLLPDASNISRIEPARHGWATRVTD